MRVDIVRQGNQNPEVAIYRYVTEGSFDTYMWQTLERKAGFIGQVTGGSITTRQIDDIDDDALSYAEVKALATGNPFIMEKAGVDSEVSRLQRLEHAHTDEQRRLRRAVEAAQRQVVSTGAKISRLEDALDLLTDTRGDAFKATIGEVTFADRTEAGEKLKSLGLAQLDETHSRDVSRHVGTLGNLPLYVETTRTIAPEVIVIVGDDLACARWSETDWHTVNPFRLITGLERRLHNLDDELVSTRERHDAALGEAARAKSRVGERFEHGPELTRLRRRQQEIEELLNPIPPETPSIGADQPTEPAAITR